MTHADATVIAIGSAGSGYATRARAPRVERRHRGARRRSDRSKRRSPRTAIEDLEPGAYDVILEPPALAEVFEWMNMIAFTGQSFEDGSSFFVGNLGKRDPRRELHARRRRVDPAFLPFPFDSKDCRSAPSRSSRTASSRTPVLDKAWADRLGLAPTATRLAASARPSTAPRFTWPWPAATPRARR